MGFTRSSISLASVAGPEISVKQGRLHIQTGKKFRNLGLQLEPQPLGFVVSVFAIQLEENAGAMIFRHLMVGSIKKSYFPGWNPA